MIFAGYYRECGVIPHTADMGFIYPRHLTLFISDLAVFVEQYNPDFLTSLEGNNSSFRIKRRLGTVRYYYLIKITLLTSCDRLKNQLLILSVDAHH